MNLNKKAYLKTRMGNPIKKSNKKYKKYKNNKKNNKEIQKQSVINKHPSLDENYSPYDWCKVDGCCHQVQCCPECEFPYIMGYGLSSYSEKFYKNNPEIEKRIKDLFSLHNEKLYDTDDNTDDDTNKFFEKFK